MGVVGGSCGAGGSLWGSVGGGTLGGQPPCRAGDGDTPPRTRVGGGGALPNSWVPPPRGFPSCDAVRRRPRQPCAGVARRACEGAAFTPLVRRTRGGHTQAASPPSPKHVSSHRSPSHEGHPPSAARELTALVPHGPARPPPCTLAPPRAPLTPPPQKRPRRGAAQQVMPSHEGSHEGSGGRGCARLSHEAGGVHVVVGGRL